VNLGEKILLGGLFSGWLMPIGVAWPRRRISPLWAWIRIVAAVWMFSVLELFVWVPRARNLDWWFYAGLAIYLARLPIKRKPDPENSR
jgi:hypothetical protein